MKENDQAID